MTTRLCVLPFGFIILIFIFYNIIYMEHAGVQFGSFNVGKTSQEPTDSSHCNLLEKITLKEFFSVVNISTDNVFQIWPLEPRLIYRALCSVESWAFNHPNASIWYIFTVEQLHDPDRIAQKMMAQYSNLKFIYVDLQKVFVGTPLHKLGLSSAWENGRFRGVHLSDLLRQVVVWHKGGYYSDTDVYPIKSLNMLRNFIMINRNKRADANLQHFGAHHPWVKAFMETIARDYRPDIYSQNGPVAAVKTANKLCDGPGGYLEVQANGSYRDCTIDGHTFRFQNDTHCKTMLLSCWKPNSGRNFDKLLQESHCFHANNGMSRRTPDGFSSRSMVQVMAERNCPLILKEAKRHSNFW